MRSGMLTMEEHPFFGPLHPVLPFVTCRSVARYLQVCLGEVVRNNEVPTLINALDGKFIEPGWNRKNKQTTVKPTRHG